MLLGTGLASGCLGLASVLTSPRGGGVEGLITAKYQQLSGRGGLRV